MFLLTHCSPRSAFVLSLPFTSLRLNISFVSLRPSSLPTKGFYPDLTPKRDVFFCFIYKDLPALLRKTRNRPEVLAYESNIRQKLWRNKFLFLNYTSSSPTLTVFTWFWWKRVVLVPSNENINLHQCVAFPLINNSSDNIVFLGGRLCYFDCYGLEGSGIIWNRGHFTPAAPVLRLSSSNGLIPVSQDLTAPWKRNHPPLSCVFLLIRTDKNDEALFVVGVPLLGDHLPVGCRRNQSVHPCAPPPGPSDISGPTVLSSEPETSSQAR